jgi:threonine dehydratase
MSSSSSSKTCTSSSIVRPLTRDSVLAAHDLIKSHIHLTPVITNKTLNGLCSTGRQPSKYQDTTNDPHNSNPISPNINLFLKAESLQKVGAFKYRGATHALLHLLNGTSTLPGPLPSPETISQAGVITHSSGNHAQALALAARTFGIPATIVMPSISTPAKIAATKGYGATVVFSGSTASEREAVVAEIMAKNPGMVLVPPYNAVDILLGQGTMGLEMQTQVQELIDREPSVSVQNEKHNVGKTARLDAVIAPVGGGGMLSGLALSFAGTGTKVFGAEPSFQGADDCRRGLLSSPKQRIEHVSSLTVADGVRTPVGEIPWSIISNPNMVEGVYAVSEEQICAATRIVYERVKLVIEPTAALGIAVALFNEEFRGMLGKQCKEENKSGWDIGVVLSGGNVDLVALGDLLNRGRGIGEWDVMRAEGVASIDGKKRPEVSNVAG